MRTRAAITPKLAARARRRALIGARSTQAARRFSTPRSAVISNGFARRTSAKPASTPPTPEPAASSRYTAPVAVAVEAPAISANNRLPAANSPPEITQKTLSVAQEVEKHRHGPQDFSGDRLAKAFAGSHRQQGERQRESQQRLKPRYEFSRMAGAHRPSPEQTCAERRPQKPVGQHHSQREFVAIEDHQ